MTWNLRYAMERIDPLATEPVESGTAGSVHYRTHKLLKPVKAPNGTQITHITTGITGNQVIVNLIDGTPANGNPTDPKLTDPDLSPQVWDAFHKHVQNLKASPDYLPKNFNPQSTETHNIILDRTKQFLRGL